MNEITQVKANSGPGRGGKRPKLTPKGRQIQDGAIQEIQNLLGDRPRHRDCLIEFLHLIQDRYGYLSESHLHALARELRIPQAEAFEVADFYAHFDIVKDGETAPPKVTVRVCDSLSCAMRGAEALIAALKDRVDDKDVRILPAPCMGRCDTAPVCEVGHRHIDNINEAKVLQEIEEYNYHPVVPEYEHLDAYRAGGGYSLLEKCVSGQVSADDIIGTLSDSGLRGLGGAGFPAGRKWTFVRSYDGPRLMTVNADEGEPGTFKDRYYLERYPHKFIEGTLIAAWAVEAERCYIYLRDEYPAVRKILENEIATLERAGLTKHCPLELRRGAGAYICGEESAMIESIEGKRGLPRHRPPYIAEVGLFGRPTLNHNVETLYWIRDIVEKGANWFADQGVRDCKGLRSYSVSGRVKKPGVVLTAAGSTVEELIEKCGGMEEGHVFKAYLPGGPSGGILPASMGDLPLDFGQLEKYGCFVGSHAVVILSDQDKMRDVALNLLRFFKDESCGQCTPCRVGCEKAVDLMDAPNWDKGLLEELSTAMQDASICGLGQAAPNPIISVLKHFSDEVLGSQSS